MYFLYILYSPSLDKFYIGQTNNIPRRLFQHLSGSSRYTKRASDWVLYHWNVYSTRAEAINAERKLKRMKVGITLFNW